MERTRALEEPISPELVLVDGDLAVRAREALPEPPWLQHAVAEQRREEAAPAAPVEGRPAPEVEPDPAPPSFSRHLRGTVVLGCSVVALVTAVALALDHVPGSAKPTLATRPAEPPAPAPPKSSKKAVKHAKAQTAVKPKPTRKAAAKPVQTKSPKRSTPPASAPKQAPTPAARAAVKVERVFTWRRFRGAAYYEVYLRRGATPVYEVRTSKRSASIRLKLRPGRYHAVVRPAMSTDAGIVLGPAIVDEILRV